MGHLWRRIGKVYWQRLKRKHQHFFPWIFSQRFRIVGIFCHFLVLCFLIQLFQFFFSTFYLIWEEYGFLGRLVGKRAPFLENWILLVVGGIDKEQIRVFTAFLYQIWYTCYVNLYIYTCVNMYIYIYTIFWSRYKYTTYKFIKVYIIYDMNYHSVLHWS